MTRGANLSFTEARASDEMFDARVREIMQESQAEDDYMRRTSFAYRHFSGILIFGFTMIAVFLVIVLGFCPHYDFVTSQTGRTLTWSGCSLGTIGLLTIFFACARSGSKSVWSALGRMVLVLGVTALLIILMWSGFVFIVNHM